MGRNNYIYVYSYQNTNYYGLSTVSSIPAAPLDYIISNDSGTGALTVQQAANIDAKIDDGMPLTGNSRRACVSL